MGNITQIRNRTKRISRLWLNEEENFSPEEIITLARGKEQFKKGEYVFFEDLRDLRDAKKSDGKKRGIPLEKVKAQLGLA